MSRPRHPFGRRRLLELPICVPQHEPEVLSAPARRAAERDVARVAAEIQRTQARADRAQAATVWLIGGLAAIVGLRVLG